MADFRKWLLAFAVIALVLGTGVVAQAQSGVNGPTTCSTTAQPVFDRAESYTDLTGDIIISCTGGSKTNNLASVPQYDVTIGLNTNITSRLYGTGNSLTGDDTEARLLIDNAGIANSGTPYTLCPHLNGCTLTGAAGAGGNPYTAAGGFTAYHGTYMPTGSTSVGAISGFNAITFLGVPIDAPGSNLARILRITNIRADATHFGILGTTNTGNTGAVFVVAYVSIAAVTPNAPTVALTSSSADVAFVIPGLVTEHTSFQGVQCSAPHGTAAVTLRENFAYAFKVRTATQLPNLTVNPGPNQLFGVESGFTADGVQKGDPGVADSGTRFIIAFRNLQNGVSLTVPSAIHGTGALVISHVTGADSTGAGGTLDFLTAAAVPTDPAKIGNITVTGTYAGGTTAASSTNTFLVYEVIQSDPTLLEDVTVGHAISYTPNVPGNIPYVLPAGTASNLLVNAFTTSQAFASFAPANITGAAGWNTAEPSYYSPGSYVSPGGASGSGADSSWIPRFVYHEALGNFVTITPCQCNLLFPYITNRVGYDTGVAIANTSMDPFGGFTDKKNAVAANSGQNGSVTMFFFGSNSTTTSASVFSIPEAGATKSIVVPAGCVYAFEMTAAQTDVGGGLPGCAAANTATGGAAAGNYLITPTGTATPLSGFEGYMIATANFQYCHGVAFLVAPGGGQGATYVAIELDTPFWAGSLGASVGRSGQYGESQGE